MFGFRTNTPVTPEVLVLQRDWDVFFFGKGFLQNIQLERAPSVSMRKYVGTKLVSDLHIKKIIRASILQRLGTKLYSRIATHQQSADQEAQ